MSNSRGTWLEMPTGNHPCDLFEPAERGEVDYVVLYLHDVRVERLRDQPHFVEQLALRHLNAIAPVTRRSWWADRISPDFDPHVTAERHVLENVVPLIEKHWGARPPRIALLGVGMGGQGALRLAYKYPDIFPVVAAVTPTIDHQLYYDDDPVLQEMYAEPEAIRQDTATLHIHPLNWPRQQFFCCPPDDYWWWESADRLRMKLSSLGIPHESDLETTADANHDQPYEAAMAPRVIEFLFSSLEKERRRLV